MSTLPAHSLQAALDNLEAGIILLDHAQRIVHWNPWFAARSDIDSHSARGRSLHDALPGIANPRLEQAVEQAVRNSLPALLSPALHAPILPLYQSKLDRRREQRIQQLIHIVPLRNDSHLACMIQVNDVTANMSRERLLRQQTEALRRRTTQDEATGLANRRTFDATLSQAFSTARLNHRPIALILGDLDLLNQFNSRHSREAGDDRLRQIGELLPTMLRPSGDLAARYGGDEIAIVLPDYSEREVCELAAQICQRIADLADSPDTSLSISLGVALMVPGPESDTDTLLSSADVALYQAKHEGRNRAIFFSVDDGNFHTCA